MQLWVGVERFGFSLFRVSPGFLFSLSLLNLVSFQHRLLFFILFYFVSNYTLPSSGFYFLLFYHTQTFFCFCNKIQQKRNSKTSQCGNLFDCVANKKTNSQQRKIKLEKKKKQKKITIFSYMTKFFIVVYKCFYLFVYFFKKHKKLWISI